MNGVELKISERALRPREPAPPLPSVTMASPLVAKRMLRPRTKAEKSLVGVDVEAALKRVRLLKRTQRLYEARLAKLVKKLRLVSANKSLSGLGASAAYTTASPAPTPMSEIVALQKEIDTLLACIKKLADEANQLAMEAVKGGASQEAVREAAGEKSVERVPVEAPPAAPVIETSTPAVLPDGSVVPGPDAKLTTPETGKPVEPVKSGEGEGEGAGTQSAKGGLGPLHMLLLAGGAYWLWKRSKRRRAV